MIGRMEYAHLYVEYLMYITHACSDDESFLVFPPKADMHVVWDREFPPLASRLAAWLLIGKRLMACGEAIYQRPGR